jgi:PAS domain-containing protein
MARNCVPTASPITEPGAVIDTIPTFAWSTTPEGLADFLNQRWRDYTGLSLDEALGYGWTKPIHPDDVSGIVSYWQTLITDALGRSPPCAHQLFGHRAEQRRQFVFAPVVQFVV